MHVRGEGSLPVAWQGNEAARRRARRTPPHPLHAQASRDRRGAGDPGHAAAPPPLGPAGTFAILTRSELFVRLTLCTMLLGATQEGITDLLAQFLQLKLGFDVGDQASPGGGGDGGGNKVGESVCRNLGLDRPWDWVEPGQGLGRAAPTPATPPLPPDSAGSPARDHGTRHAGGAGPPAAAAALHFQGPGPALAGPERAAAVPGGHRRRRNQGAGAHGRRICHPG